MDRPSDLTATLLANRHAFRAFLASRLGNEADAEDLLQNGLVKALQRADEVKDGEKVVAWFYQVLRRVSGRLRLRVALFVRAQGGGRAREGAALCRDGRRTVFIAA